MKREDIVLTCTIIGAVTAIIGAVMSIDISIKMSRIGREAEHIADNLKEKVREARADDSRRW